VRENARAYEAHRNFMCTTIPSAQWGKPLYGVAIKKFRNLILEERPIFSGTFHKNSDMLNTLDSGIDVAPGINVAPKTF
jgi:hypothetical protein